MCQSIIGKLPEECLQHIFTQCLSSQPFSPPTKEAAPLLLIQVCKSWRKVGLSTAELWCSLDFASCQFSEKDVEFLASWLKRSGDCRPLCIRLALRSEYYSDDEGEGQIVRCIFNESAAKALGIFLSCLGRWQQAELVWEWSELPLPAVACSVPKLETFTLKAINAPLEKTKTSINHLLHDAPKLRRFELSNGQEGLTSQMPTPLLLPWTKILHLGLDYEMSLTECIEKLRQCEILETAIFRRIGRLPAEIPDNQIIYPLIRLNRLEVSSVEDLSPLLASLRLPSLHRIRIEMGWEEAEEPAGDVDEWPHTAFREMLHESHCQIMDLEMIGPLQEEDLIQCLLDVSVTLQNLYLGEAISVSPRTFDLLTKVDLFPNLILFSPSQSIPPVWQEMFLARNVNIANQY
jgi:hypothetical protein